MSAPEIPQSCHGFCNDAMGRDDATTLAERVRRREISITTVEETALRLEKL